MCFTEMCKKNKNYMTGLFFKSMLSFHSRKLNYSVFFRLDKGTQRSKARLHMCAKIIQVAHGQRRGPRSQTNTHRVIRCGGGWEMGAASCPHIADEGWAGFRETKARERGRVQRLSQTSRSAGGGMGERWWEGHVPTSHICYSFVPSWEENSRKRSGGGGR